MKIGDVVNIKEILKKKKCSEEYDQLNTFDQRALNREKVANLNRRNEDGVEST